MVKAQYDIVIAGAGMAGLAAANALTGHGLEILIIDENNHTGGQLLRTSAPHKRSLFQNFLDPVKEAGFTLMAGLKKTGDIHWLNHAEITGIFKDNQLLVRKTDQGTCMEIQARQLIFTTGARERYLPFKGWTLPNVMSLGAAQILMKSHGILPAAETLLGGSSPLMMAVAHQIITSGGRVAGMADEKGLREKSTFIPLVPDHPAKLIQGGTYTLAMLMNRVKTYQGYRIIEARGDNRFKSAVIAKTNKNGIPIQGTEKILKAGALAMGYGFVPNIELPVQAGCGTEYNDALGGWIVTTDRHFETTCPGIFAAGELTGIGGAEKSLIQGRLCGLSILECLGKCPKGKQSAHKTEISRLRNQDKNQIGYARFFNALTRLPASAYTAIPDDTLICRCEGITMGLIKKRVAQGFTTTAGLKKASRAGMGLCQGRICGPVIHDIITALTHQPPETIGLSLSRPPVKNMPANALLSN